MHLYASYVSEAYSVISKRSKMVGGGDFRKFEATIRGERAISQLNYGFSTVVRLHLSTGFQLLRNVFTDLCNQLFLFL